MKNILNISTSAIKLAPYSSKLIKVCIYRSMMYTYLNLNSIPFDKSQELFTYHHQYYKLII